MSQRAFLVAGVLLCIVASALALSSTRANVSTLPSARNPGPAGLRALALYLQEGGRDVEVNVDPWSQLSSGGTLIVAEPLAEAPAADEVQALKDFVENGGTAILLHDRSDHVSRELESALGAGSFLESDVEESVSDVLHDAQGSGSTVTPLLPDLPFEEVNVGARGSLALEGGAGLLGEGGTLYAAVARRGEGYVVALAGPDPFQDRFVGQADDLAFDLTALSLSRGPVRFEERLLHASPTQVPIPGLWATLGQLSLVALVLSLARGRRLGSPRPTRRPVGRSSLLYVAQLAGLYRRARVEGALARELYPELRRLLHERLQLPAGLDDESVDEILSERGTLQRGGWLSLAARIRSAPDGLAPKDWTRLSREAAQLVASVETGRGRQASSASTIVTERSIS